MTYADITMFETSYAAFKGRNVGIKNCLQGIRICQLVTSSATDILNLLQEMRALAVNNASGSLNSNDTANNNTAYESFLEEIERIANTTQWNEKKLMNVTTAESITVQIGYDKDDTHTIALKNYQNGNGNNNVFDIQNDITANPSLSMTSIDTAIESVTAEVAQSEADKDRLIMASEYLRSLNIVEIKNMMHLRDVSEEVRTHIAKLDRLRTSNYVPIDWDYATRQINYNL